MLKRLGDSPWQIRPLDWIGVRGVSRKVLVPLATPDVGKREVRELGITVCIGVLPCERCERDCRDDR